MHTRPFVSLCRRTILTGGFALIIPLSGITADNAPPEALNVKVFPDRYVAAGKSFADLSTLEAWAKPILIRALWLDNCSPASTTQLLAAVERFHTAYSDGIQIRALSPGEARCVLAAGNDGHTLADMQSVRADTEYFAADELGRSKLP